MSAVEMKRNQRAFVLVEAEPGKEVAEEKIIPEKPLPKEERPERAIEIENILYILLALASVAVVISSTFLIYRYVKKSRPRGTGEVELEKINDELKKIRGLMR